MEEIFNDLNMEQAESDDANDLSEKKRNDDNVPNSAEFDDAMETLTKLSLFTDDVDFDSLLPKLTENITQNILQTIRQSSI